MSDNKPLDLDELMQKIDSVGQSGSTTEEQSGSTTEEQSGSTREEQSGSTKEEAPTSEQKTTFNIDTSKVRLVIATPCYGGGIQAHYLISLISTIELLREKGIEYEVSILPGDSLVQRARNALVAKFLSNPKNTHMLFIDADIHWNPIEILKLLSHDKAVVGGLYPKKAWKWENLKDVESFKGKGCLSHNQGISETDLIKHNLLTYDVNYIPGKPVGIMNNQIEVRHVATGFMMIQRATFERIIECVGDEIKYTDDCGALNESENPFLYAFFYFLEGPREVPGV